MLENINWYPGHMKKTRDMIQENLKLVDLVVEVVDARIPVSSRNPILDEIIKEKERVLLLNKYDLADPDMTVHWIKQFRSRGLTAMRMNAMRGDGIKEFLKWTEKTRSERNDRTQINKPFRLMIVGVPNSGKSSLINRLTGRKSTQTGDRPGVTKGKQWLTVKSEGPMGTIQLLDTPGILWPKIEDPQVGLNLAYCGSIKDQVMDLEELALALIGLLSQRYPELLINRYHLDLGGEREDEEPTALEMMEQIALKRGFLMSGKRVDYARTARTILDEFRGGLLGHITLETPEDLHDTK